MDEHCGGRVCDVRRRAAARKPRGSRAGDGSHWNGHGRSCRRSQLVYGISRAVERRPSGHSSAQAAFNQAVAEGQTKEDAFNAALAACGSEAGAVAAHHRDAHGLVRRSR